MTTTRPLALVTGASAGIGAAYARRLAAQGYDLLLVARRVDRLKELAAELSHRHGVRAEPLPADLTKDAELKAVEDRIAHEEHLEFLLNNAGFGSSGLFLESPLEIQDSMHRLHVMATLRLSHAALGKMARRGKGAVVNVSSVAAFIARPGSISYHATKAWMNCFTEGLYLELKRARSPVRVQALCPGYTLTEFHDVMGFDRGQVPANMWTPVEQVVDASLEGLKRNKLFVVPGWRYKFIVSLLRLMPRSLLHAASSIEGQRARKKR
ncbi:MAG TPA: SDR family oxidoreductase [Terriglobia bacterium]|nr:SDR family oxidoreductase [Terriglobia bacterium]